MRCRTILFDRLVQPSALFRQCRSAHAMPCRQLKVPNMAPAYNLKKSHLPSSEGAACCPSSSCTRLPQRTPAVAHLIKDLEVDNPRLELTLAQRLGTAAPSPSPSPSHARHRLGLVEAPPPLLTLEVLPAPSPRLRLFASFYCRAAMGGGGAKGARAQRQRASVSHMQRAVQTRRPSAPSRAKVMRSALTSRR